MDGVTFVYCLTSGTQLLETGWTLFYSGVAKGQRSQMDVGIVTSPLLGALVLRVLPGEQENSLSVVLSCRKEGFDCRLFLCIIQNTCFSSGDFFVFLGDFRNCLPHLKHSDVLLPDFCAQHGLSITDTMFKHRAVQKCTWYQAATFGQRLLIDFTIISSGSMSWTLW